MTANFVHLRLHTEFSLVDSVVRVDELVEAVAAALMPAVGVSDAGNLFAMVKFYRAALARGVQPIIGVDLRIKEGADPQGPSQITLLCQNLTGYRNLTRLVSRAWLEGQVKGEPLIERSWLTGTTTEGLIALSGAQQSDLGRALQQGRVAQAEQALGAWLALLASTAGASGNSSRICSGVRRNCCGV